MIPLLSVNFKEYLDKKYTDNLEEAVNEYYPEQSIDFEELMCTINSDRYAPNDLIEALNECPKLMRGIIASIFSSNTSSPIELYSFIRYNLGVDDLVKYGFDKCGPEGCGTGTEILLCFYRLLYFTQYFDTRESRVRFQSDSDC